MQTSVQQIAGRVLFFLLALLMGLGPPLAFDHPQYCGVQEAVRAGAGPRRLSGMLAGASLGEIAFRCGA